MDSWIHENSWIVNYLIKDKSEVLIHEKTIIIVDDTNFLFCGK